MTKQNAGENSKKLKDSRNQPVSPKKSKNNNNNLSMSPKRSQNSGGRLWNALEALENAKAKFKKRKLEIELKKDAELSNEGIKKLVKLERKIEEEVEEIAMPIPMLLLKETMTQLQGIKIIKFVEKLEKQVKEMQELCKKLELNDKIEEEDLNQLKGIKKESAKHYKELVSYIPYSNPIMLYTSVIGVSLTAGLVASTVLEHTTRLSMLAIIGIAAVSVLIAGGVTYRALKPSTKVDESRESHISRSTSLV